MEIVCVDHLPNCVIMSGREGASAELESVLAQEARVTHVSSQKELMPLLEEKSADLIVFDEELFDSGGIDPADLLPKISEKLPSLPLVIMARMLSPEKEEHFFSLGIRDFFLTPPRGEVVQKRLRRLLRYAYMKNLTRDLSVQIKLAEERLDVSRHLFEEMVLALAKTIDAKDKYTHGHSERVADYARQIAVEAGEPKRTQEEIYYIGLVHDIGKIGIPRTIINKPGRLTDDEFHEIQTHTVIGASILQDIDEVPWFAIGAHYHHERYDGLGYPQKLKGHQIPKYARIIAVADAYDAMTSMRSYRKALSQKAVREEIAKGRGRQFDPFYADIMLGMIDRDANFDMREKYEEGMIKKAGLGGAGADTEMKGKDRKERIWKC